MLLPEPLDLLEDLPEGTTARTSHTTVQCVTPVMTENHSQGPLKGEIGVNQSSTLLF